MKRISLSINYKNINRYTLKKTDKTACPGQRNPGISPALFHAGAHILNIPHKTGIGF